MNELNQLRRRVDWKGKSITRLDESVVRFRSAATTTRCNNCNQQKHRIFHIGSKMIRVGLCTMCNHDLRRAGPKLVSHTAQEA